MDTQPVLTPEQRRQLILAPLPQIRIIGSGARGCGSLIHTQSYNEATNGRRVPGHVPDDDPYWSV